MRTILFNVTAICSLSLSVNSTASTLQDCVRAMPYAESAVHGRIQLYAVGDRGHRTGEAWGCCQIRPGVVADLQRWGYRFQRSDCWEYRKSLRMTEIWLRRTCGTRARPEVYFRAWRAGANDRHNVRVYVGRHMSEYRRVTTKGNRILIASVGRP